MNYKEQIERFQQLMRDYPAGSKRHELAKEAFAEYVHQANKQAMNNRSENDR